MGRLEAAGSSYGASREARRPEAFAPASGHRYGVPTTLEAPRVAKAEIGLPAGKPVRTVVAAADQTDASRSAGSDVFADETGEGSGTRKDPLPRYVVERSGTVLEPLRDAAAAMLGWTGRVTSSVLQRTVELLENILPQGGYGKQGPPERAPPLPPGTGSPGSAFSGAGIGEVGSGQLFAVLSLLIILARGGRFWPPYELPRPRLVVRLVSERPG